MARRDLRPLDTFGAGQHVLIREARDDDPERLRRWQTLGLMPGVTVFFVHHQPLDDLYELRVGDVVFPLGSEGLRGLLGEEVAG